MRLFFTDEVQQIPRPVRKHYPMHFRIFLHRVEKVIQRIFG